MSTPYTPHDRARFLAIQAAAKQMRQTDRAYAAAYAVAQQQEAQRATTPRPGLLARLFGRTNGERA